MHKNVRQLQKQSRKYTIANNINTCTTSLFYNSAYGSENKSVILVSTFEDVSFLKANFNYYNSRQVSSLSHSSRKKEHKEGHKSKRRKEEADSTQRSQSSNLVNAPPTNHEREGPRTPPLPSPVECSSSSWSQPQREYHSYFERPGEPSEDEGR